MRPTHTRIALIAATLVVAAVPVAHAQTQGDVDRARANGSAVGGDSTQPAESSPTELNTAAPDPGAAPADGAPGMVAVPPGNAAATAASLDTYTIQSGDTLWDICAKMLGDPFFWPKLWTFNQYITNPHWIYPGNVLRFHEGTETAPPQFEVTKPGTEPVAVSPAAIPAAPVADDNIQEGGGAASEQPIATPMVAMADPYAIPAPVVDHGPFSINLRQEGFIAEAQIPPLGFIYKSDEAKRNLAESDLVYIRLNDPSSAQIGKKFTVYRTLRRVKHPKTHGYLGYLIKILAEMEITAVNGEVATAKVVSSYDYINRGDPITDFVDVLKNVSLAPNGSSVEGVIVETMADGTTLAGDGDVLYLDKGQDDGLKIGNTLDVVRSGDGLKRPYDHDSSLPNQVVGRLVVVGTRARTATAVVLDSYDALTIGDKVRIVQN
jgi:hypothetical protein